MNAEKNEQTDRAKLTELCRVRFDVMHDLEKQLIPLRSRCDAAREAWESACLDLAFVENPEIKEAIEAVERIEAELRVAKQVVSMLALRTTCHHKFRKWMS